MRTPSFHPSPQRPLDDGRRDGTEVWRTREGIVFHHWDRWLLRLACEEPGGLPVLRKKWPTGASRHALGSSEEIQAQIRDLQQRLDRLGVAPHDLLDEQERTSDWLLKKAQKRVLLDGSHARTEAMWRTPRRRLEARMLRGFWPDFPVSPARFEAALRQPSPLPSIPVLEFELEQLALAATSDAERLAIHRAVMTLIVEAMRGVHDEGWELGMAYREHEKAYLFLARSFLGVPAILHDLISLVVWEGYGLTHLIPGFLRDLPVEPATLALKLLAEDLVELREVGLSHQAEKTEELRRAVLSSHPELASESTKALHTQPAASRTTPLEAPRPATPAPGVAPCPPKPIPAQPPSPARASGDPPGLASVTPPDPSRQMDPFQYLDRVAACLTAGELPQAVFWGEEGLARWPRGLQGKLHRKVAETYEAQGRLDDAVEVLWRGFVAVPGVEAFRALRRRAARLDEWPWWRQQALDHLHIAPPDPRDAASVVVEILLFEGQAQEALREAKRRPCKPHLWAVLADTLAKDHPLTAIEIYRDHVSKKLRTRDSKQGFEVAAAPLRTLARSTKNTGAEPVFRALLTWLREEHANYKHILALLDSEELR